MAHTEVSCHTRWRWSVVLLLMMCRMQVPIYMNEFAPSTQSPPISICTSQMQACDHSQTPGAPRPSSTYFRQCLQPTLLARSGQHTFLGTLFSTSLIRSCDTTMAATAGSPRTAAHTISCDRTKPVQARQSSRGTRRDVQSRRKERTCQAAECCSCGRSCICESSDSTVQSLA